MLRCASGTCRPIYRIVHTDTCDTSKRDSWLEWRKEKKTVPTSSTLCSYFGHGFVSLNKVIQDKITEKPSITQEGGGNYNSLFSERAKAHGSNQEINAKKLFKKYLKKNKKIGEFYKRIGSGEISYQSCIAYDNEVSEVICTPDDLFVFSDSRGWGKMVVEYKCPYKVVLDKGDKTIAQVAKEFHFKYPKGKENAFVQAATYALWCQADVFYTIFFFTDTIEEDYIVIYRYSPCSSLYTELFEALKDTQGYLNELNDFNQQTKPPVFRTKPNKKKLLSQLMELCYESTIIYCSLDE